MRSVLSCGSTPSVYQTYTSRRKATRRPGVLDAAPLQVPQMRHLRRLRTMPRGTLRDAAGIIRDTDRHGKPRYRSPPERRALSGLKEQGQASRRGRVEQCLSLGGKAPQRRGLDYLGGPVGVGAGFEALP